MDKKENQDYLNRGEKELRELCAQTGGKLFFPKDNVDVQRLFTQIGAELRSQYIIVYEPSNTSVDGHFRAIEVRLAGKFGERPWQVRTRRGYIAARDTRAD
jgi:VWFA-related protein